MGWGTSLGLPYKAIAVAREIANGLAVGTTGTLVVPALNDPASSGSGDTRGTFKPTTLLNGANIISAVFDMVNDINSNNNGGLHRYQGGVITLGAPRVATLRAVHVPSRLVHRLLLWSKPWLVQSLMTSLLM